MTKKEAAMAAEIPKPDTKAEQLLLVVVERLDALLAVLAPPPPPDPKPDPVRTPKTTPRRRS
jgi:hypothetical protein